MQKINNLKSAIHSELKGNVALMALINGVYNLNVKDGIEMPYVTYFIVTQRGDDNFSNTIDYPWIQVDCYAQKTVTKSAQQLAGEVAEAVANVLDDVTLTITGYTCVCFHREATREVWDPILKAWDIIIDYRGMIEQPK